MIAYAANRSAPNAADELALQPRLHALPTFGPSRSNPASQTRSPAWQLTCHSLATAQAFSAVQLSAKEAPRTCPSDPMQCGWSAELAGASILALGLTVIRIGQDPPWSWWRLSPDCQGGVFRRDWIESAATAPTVEESRDAGLQQFSATIGGATAWSEAG